MFSKVFGSGGVTIHQTSEEPKTAFEWLAELLSGC